MNPTWQKEFREISLSSRQRGIAAGVLGFENRERGIGGLCWLAVAAEASGAGIACFVDVRNPGHFSLCERLSRESLLTIAIGLRTRFWNRWRSMQPSFTSWCSLRTMAAYFNASSATSIAHCFRRTIGVVDLPGYLIDFAHSNFEGV